MALASQPIQLPTHQKEHTTSSMKQTHPNSQPIDIVAVMFDGSRQKFRVEPGDAIIDAQGYVRMLTIVVADGGRCEMTLLPKSHTAAQARSLVSNWLLPFGLMLVAGRFVQGTKPIHNVVRYVGAKLGAISAGDLLEEWSLPHSAYFTLDTGEMIISQPIRVATQTQGSRY